MGRFIFSQLVVDRAKNITSKKVLNGGGALLEHARFVMFSILIYLIALGQASAQFTQQGSKLVGTGAAGNAFQGASVSLSSDGNTAIVGGFDDHSGAGAAWVFTRSGGVWTQQGSELVGTGAVGSALQGISVSLSSDGNTAIVGGCGDNNYAGAAWVFTRSAGVWTQQGSKLVGTGAVGDANQGISVSLSSDGNTAIVGGYIDNSGAGATWVFTRTGDVWTQQGSKLVGTGAVGTASQGGSVSLSSDGNTAIVGGYGDNSNAGAAWVFTRSAGVWTQQGNKLVGSGAVGSAWQGIFVSLSSDGNTAIVAGYLDNDSTGAAWVWTRSGGVWTQQGSKLVGTGAVGDATQGTSVSLSSDGNTAIIGGFRDNNFAGAAWVWTRSGGVWTQQGSKLVGTGAVDPASQGTSVSLSSDGNTVIIGGDSDNGDVGAVWIYATPSAPQPVESYSPVMISTPDNLPKGSVWFVSEDSGSVWIAGDSALVAKADTSDLSTWSLLNIGIPATVGINWLEFINTSTIFAAGQNGEIYKTTDGGLSWNSIYSNPSLTNFIDRITFFDANHGMAWGDGLSPSSIQACLETTDGGTSWTNNNSYLVGYGSYNVVRFVPPSSVFFSGDYYGSATLYHGIWRSTDMGSNWSFATVGTSSADSVTYSYSCDFKNNLTGVACRSDSTFWSTSDGGVTWQQIGSKTPARCFYVSYVNGTNTAMAGGGGYASVAAVHVDARTVTLFQDSSQNIGFSQVSFPTLTRGYMSNGLTRAFYSTTSSVPLAVELSSFGAIIENNSVILRWSTATEINNYGFKVERRSVSNSELAADNSQWLKVGFVKGAGTSNAPRQYSYVDGGLASGLYAYRMQQIDQNGVLKYSQEVQVAVGSAPRMFSLSQNYPNPFNPTTTIDFTLPSDGRVMLKIYDIIGREVATLVDENRKAGVYQQAVFDASRFASGVYFARLEFGGKQLLKKMLLLK